MSEPTQALAPWQHGADIAEIGDQHRRALLNLERLEQPPVLLEGAALIIHDAVDGQRDTDAIIDHLSGRFPDVHGLADEVRDCLRQLDVTGIITTRPTPPEDVSTTA